MKTREEVAEMAQFAKWRGLRVGLASGAFDLFHAGHVSFLTGLAQRVDKLYVAVACDAIVSAKAVGRPVIPQIERLEIVEALRCVEAAFIFTEYGDQDNLLAILPHVFGRGDGHTADMYEAATLKEFGIEIALLHTLRITSTTEIIARIRQ